MMKTDEMVSRAREATVKFLERRGYEILDREPEGIGAVAKDDGTIVFVEVRVRDGAERGFDDGPLDRKGFEIAAASWLAGHGEVGIDMPVRLDVVSLLVFGPDRALLRHHINAASEG